MTTPKYQAEGPLLACFPRQLI